METSIRRPRMFRRAPLTALGRITAIALLDNLAHPALFHTFAFTVISVALGLVGAVAGVGATVEHYRPPAVAGRPRWLLPFLGVVAVLSLGTIIVYAPRPSRGEQRPSRGAGGTANRLDPGLPL